MAKITNQYINNLFGKDLPKQNIDNIKKTMKKYGDNYWWESKDLIEIAKYQIFEPTLLVEFSKFHEGIEKLIGRPVYTHELGLNVEGLRQEVKEAIARLEGKLEALDKNVAVEREAQGINTLIDYCQEKGKPLVAVKI